MADILKILKERGFLSQLTNERDLCNQLNKESTTFYVGIDPTGYSMHIGHFMLVMASAHMARFGHRPIFVLGGGTSLVGDPSGKMEMRAIQSKGQVEEKVKAISFQISEFAASLGLKNYLILNNADWLMGLEYIDFLRDIGRHFSVNRMISFETYKKRFETGLSFIEFNYQLLQSYDFLQLFEKQNCLLQIGGDDQWGNIVAGIDLIRRIKAGKAYGMTFNLITRSDGKKMGKTEKGAIFLDSKLTSSYDMYQYWRNVSDDDVRKLLLLYTFLSIEKIDELTKGGGRALNYAKEILAFEATSIIHGELSAKEAQAMAKSLFDGLGERAPEIALSLKNVKPEMTILDFCVMIGLCSSKGEARRIIEGGGLYVDGKRVGNASPDALQALLSTDSVLIRQGKKKYIRVLLEK